MKDLELENIDVFTDAWYTCI